MLRPFQTPVPVFWNGGRRPKDRESELISEYDLEIEEGTYLIFELRYLHDKSGVLILSNKINDK